MAAENESNAQSAIIEAKNGSQESKNRPQYGHIRLDISNSVLPLDKLSPTPSAKDGLSDEEEMQKKLLGIKKEVFPITSIYNFSNLTYPGGLWSFTVGSKKYHPVKDFNSARVDASGLTFEYYNKQIHTGAFAIPTFMRQNLGDLIQE